MKINQLFLLACFATALLNAAQPPPSPSPRAAKTGFYKHNTSLVPRHIYDLGIDNTFEINDFNDPEYKENKQRNPFSGFDGEPTRYTDLAELIYYGDARLTQEERTAEFEKFKKGKEEFVKHHGAIYSAMVGECNSVTKYLEDTTITVHNMHALGKIIKDKYITPRDKRIDSLTKNLADLRTAAYQRQLGKTKTANRRAKITGLLLAATGFAGGVWAAPYLRPYLGIVKDAVWPKK